MKLIINKLLCGICAVSVFLSCTKESQTVEQSQAVLSNELTHDEIIALDTYVNGTSLSEEEINSNIEMIMSALDNNSMTKGASQRFVSDLTPISSSYGATKSSMEDTLAYIVNFGDSQGYSVISADRRTDEIFVVSPSGNLNLETLGQDYYDGKVPENVLFLLSNIDELMQEQIAEFEADSENLSQSAIDKITSEGGTKSMCPDKISIKNRYCLLMEEAAPCYVERTTDWTNEKFGSINPMIRVQWGQGSPFYYKTPTIDGKQTLTGCVATAMAQLMSYWKYPSDSDSCSCDHYYDWDLLNKYPSYMVYTTDFMNEVSRLMYDIGKGVNMKYGIEGSSAFAESAVNYFSEIGFVNPGTYADYDFSSVLNSIYCGYPVLMSGYKTCIKRYIDLWLFRIYLKISYKDGHCWVIDGALRQSKTTTLYYDGAVVDVSTKYRTLLHCNFGWNGHYNGYYASGVFDTNKQITTKGTTGYNFQYNLHAIYNIHPRRSLTDVINDILDDF